MRIRLGLTVWAVCAYGQAVSSITFDGVGDSSVRMIFNVSASFNALRVRYGTSSCASGSGGTVQTTGTAIGTYVLFGMTADLSGLAPSTLYHACPEVSSDGGSSWSSGAEATFTTLARSQTLPLPPAPVSTSFPAQTGSTLNVAADCSNLQAQINAAVAGDTIVIPAGTVCTGTYTTPPAPEAKTFGPSSVVTSTSTLAIPAHGFTENQEVHFSTDGANANCLPGMTLVPATTGQAFFNCDLGGGWNKGAKYYVHVPDANHVQILNAVGGTPAVPGWINFTADPVAGTIVFAPSWATVGGYGYLSGGTPIPANTPVQFVSTGTLPGGLSLDTTYYMLSGCASSPNAACVTQVSLSSGGAPVNLTSAGTGTHTIVDRGLGVMYLAPAPTQAGPWVLIQTGGTLPPAGTRIDNTTDAQLFHLRKTTYDITPVFAPGILAHNWRIRGALFDTGTNTDYLTSTDPRPFCGGPTTNQDNRYIVFDQDRIQGPGYPNRFGCRNGGANMFWNGGYISVINSDLRGLDFWHSWYGATTGVNGGGLVPTRVSEILVTATPGVGHGGVFTTTTTGTTFINFMGGAATGTAYVYFAMYGTMAVLAPAGMSGNCSTTGTTCAFSTSGSPGWPVDANGRRAALALFTITLTAGSVTAVAGANPTFAPGPPGVSEGANSIIAGAGPGPYLISNNYISGAGLTLHFDDGGGPLTARGDYTISKNDFVVPATMQLLGVSSDGLWYGNRQPLEWKGGQRILVSGNSFTGCFAQVNNIGTCIIMTPRGGGTVTDVNVTNNQFTGVGGAMMIASPLDSFAPVSVPAARQSFSNNLATINAWTHYVPTEAQPNGFFFYGANAVEDLTISHNTIYDSRGAAPAFLHWAAAPIGGVSITDNIYFYTGNAPAFQSEIIANCPSINDKAMMDCAFTAGPGNPSYTFSKNLYVPSWTDTSVPRGVVTDGTINAAYGTLFTGGSNSLVPDQGSQAANVARANFANTLVLNPASPYYAACSGGTACGYTPTSLTAKPNIKGVLNIASLAAGPVAPGEIVSIGGTGLGPASPISQTPAQEVPTASGGVSALFNGIPAPLLFVSASQINAVVPYEIAGAADLSVTVTFQGQASDAYPLALADANPALLTLDGSGSGPAAILNQDNSTNTRNNAAAKGSQIVIYLTGEGQTDPPGVTGKITSSSTSPWPPRPVLPVAAFINGVPAPTVFYGEAPGLISGIMQLDVRIPGTVPSGDLPISVSVGDKVSQTGVTVSVQ
jgi:uncharacterized protein (TIGR03437 family)